MGSHSFPSTENASRVMYSQTFDLMTTIARSFTVCQGHQLLRGVCMLELYSIAGFSRLCGVPYYELGTYSPPAWFK